MLIHTEQSATDTDFHIGHEVSNEPTSTRIEERTGGA